MRDITDYFGTPNKCSSNSISDTKKDIGRCISENNSKPQITDNTENIEGTKKRKKKRGKRKSDPVVKNIADLLTNNLCIVSPNSSVSVQLDTRKSEEDKTQTTDNFKRNSVEEVPVLVLDESSSSSLPKDETSQSNSSNTGTIQKEDKGTNKLNAFQFMMESRNKSIGQNSPGKDRLSDDESINTEDMKQVLYVRKNLLQSWSEKKGGKKRKMEEEEKEEIINYKLQKRAKRLKKLLRVEENKNDNSCIRNKTKRKIKRISSTSSENTKDSVELVEESKADSSLEIIEENAQDELLNNSKMKETKQGTLTFFGVVNKLKNDEKVENVQEKKARKKKLHTSKIEERVNKSADDADFDKNRKDLTKPQKSIIRKQKHREKQASQESVSNKSKTPNGKLKEDGDGNFTPRSLKLWRMKIKIDDDNEENDGKSEQRRSQRIKKIPGYKSLFSEEISDEDTPSISQRKRQIEVVENDEDVMYVANNSSKKKTDSAKSLKVAPVFVKATPKPKLAPELVEARKQFLMSGIPDSLKRTIEKQQSFDDRAYDVFPSISHIQQQCGTNPFWRLTNPHLDIKELSPLKIKPLNCTNITNKVIINTSNNQKEVEKIEKLKTLVNKIKLDNPNYPVYKSFRLIHEKSGKSLTKKKEPVPKHTKRGSKSTDIEIIENKPDTTDAIEHAMWTDKYKPKCSDEIVGNTGGIKNLKKWLEMWKHFSDEINLRKKRRDGFCSDSEFDTTDCDSEDSTKLPGNTLVVGGPCGSGKSSAIYAICNELGFNVIELNASSKRTGKRLLQELQEATQSHQVRKKKSSINNFIQSNNLEKDADIRRQIDKKMCVLLIEDVDIVFEQDDGFISALSQLVSCSKRPIIMTTTEYNSVCVHKFISQYEYIPFLPLSSQSLAVWLQILCLVEGVFVDHNDLGSLLEYNKGDVRKTLLQLQFWVQSGSKIIRDDLPLKTKSDNVFCDNEQAPYLDTGLDNVVINSNCIKSFHIFKLDKFYKIPYHINLGLLWWNTPSILGIPNFSKCRINKFKAISDEDKNTVTKLQTKLSRIERQKLSCISKIYDCLAFTDISFRSANYFDNLEPGVKNNSYEIRDSLELSETEECYSGYKDFVHEVTHILVNGYMQKYNDFEKGESVFNIAVPEKSERRWRAKMHICEDVLLEVVPISNFVERRSIALDYMPCLRNISRSESCRATNNTKRRNRFRNYLRGLGINYNDNTLKLACNILNVHDL